MTIAEYISNQVFKPRLEQSGVLVVYDPDARYRELCADLDGVCFIDAGKDGLAARDLSLAALQELGRATKRVEGLLIYVPVAKPLTDHDKQCDPFALYLTCGAVFPAGDADTYQNLCLAAKPEYTTEIQTLFAREAAPAFTVVDALGAGQSWPLLFDLCETDSRELVLTTLLAPKEEMQGRFAPNGPWFDEAMDMCRVLFSWTPQTQIKERGPLSDELWRFLLFSEFFFDLPVPLPEALVLVPHAAKEKQVFIYRVCKQLRTHCRSAYLLAAERIEQELHLQDHCTGIDDFGERDTFPFEERTFLVQAIRALSTHSFEQAERIIVRHGATVWVERGENQVRWNSLNTALVLLRKIAMIKKQPLPIDLSRLFEQYSSTFHDTDRLYREFEETIAGFFDTDGVLDATIEQCRKAYSEYTDALGNVWFNALTSAGWPVDGQISAINTFTNNIKPLLLQHGNRVAYIFVDALRYELGAEWTRIFTQKWPTECTAVCAALPSITSVGMSALLPEAELKLKIVKDGEKMRPKHGGLFTDTPQDRMQVFKQYYGDRVMEYVLDKFLERKQPLSDSVQLLILRTQDVDDSFESNPGLAFGQINNVLKKIRLALHRLQEGGFRTAYIVADHGFFLRLHPSIGDVCTKPSGTWINLHDRMLLGEGSTNSQNVVLSAEKLGIRGDFSLAAFPQSMAAYSRGKQYVHGGCSPQEAIIPLIRVTLQEEKTQTIALPRIKIVYRQGSNKITSRTPVLQIDADYDLLVTDDTMIEVLVRAIDPTTKNVVGEITPGEHVDPAARTVRLNTQHITVNVTLRMSDTYEGPVVIQALDPTTNEMYSSLSLTVEYLV